MGDIVDQFLNILGQTQFIAVPPHHLKDGEDDQQDQHHRGKEHHSGLTEEKAGSVGETDHHLVSAGLQHFPQALGIASALPDKEVDGTASDGILIIPCDEEVIFQIDVIDRQFRIDGSMDLIPDAGRNRLRSRKKGIAFHALTHGITYQTVIVKVGNGFVESQVDAVPEYLLLESYGIDNPLDLDQEQDHQHGHGHPKEIFPQGFLHTLLFKYSRTGFNCRGTMVLKMVSRYRRANLAKIKE